MEKKKYENPELTIIYFEGNLATDDDIIEASGNVGNEWPQGDWGND